VVRTFEVVRSEFDAAIQVSLEQLHRALTQTSLDPFDLRQLTSQRLMQFAIAAKSVAKPERLKSLRDAPGLAQYVDEQLAEFDRVLEFEIRQFDVGLSDATRPPVPPAKLTPDMGSKSGSSEKSQTAPNKEVFIVHGHDELAKMQVALFIQRAGLNAVILHEQPNAGRTIIEKFEDHGGSAGFAVVLATPDDVGGPDHDHLRPRARQNVIGEMFWFAGKLGRERVCVLVKDDVEMPSDVAGLVYTKMDDRGAWKADLLKELTNAGYAVDWARAMA
jgi:predicted nucleotide-binding protein